MPQRKSGVKSLRADKKRRARNTTIKTDLKKTIKQLRSLIDAKNAAEAQATFKKLIAKLDRAALKGIIHKNLASRKKSQFSRYLKNIT
ncbi:30S ribosomal protein S20 [Candidatus Omnitrophota bacterium]